MEKSSAHFKCFESNPPLPTMRRWMVCGHPIQQYAEFNSFFPTESHWFPLQPRASCCPNVHLDLGHSRLWSARSELVGVWHVCLANGNQFVIFKWITHLQEVGWIEPEKWSFPQDAHENSSFEFGRHAELVCTGKRPQHCSPTFRRTILWRILRSTLLFLFATWSNTTLYPPSMTVERSLNTLPFLAT